MLRFPCPCCGFVVFAEPPGSHETCPRCAWIDDAVQLRWPSLAGGANDSSLWSAQAAWSRRRDLVADGAARGAFRREFGWRQLDPSSDAALLLDQREAGRRQSWPRDLTAYYYWRWVGRGQERDLARIG